MFYPRPSMTGQLRNECSVLTTFLQGLLRNMPNSHDYQLHSPDKETQTQTQHATTVRALDAKLTSQTHIQNATANPLVP